MRFRFSRVPKNTLAPSQNPTFPSSQPTLEPHFLHFLPSKSLPFSTFSSQTIKKPHFLALLSPSKSNIFSTSPFSLINQVNTWSSIRKESTSTTQQESSSSSTKQPMLATVRVSEIVDEISGLTLLEVADLTEVLREKLNVGEMPIMAMMTPGMGIGGIRLGGKGTGSKGGEEEKKKEEKTAFDLKLESFEVASKIKIIKEVRTFTDLGLKEAKDLVEKAPALLKKGVSKEEAVKIVEKMKELGAKVVME